MATSYCFSSFSKLEPTKKQKGQTKSDQTSIRIGMEFIPFFVSRLLSGRFFLGPVNDLLDLIDGEGFYINAVAFYGDEKDFFLALGVVILV